MLLRGSTCGQLLLAIALALPCARAHGADEPPASQPAATAPSDAEAARDQQLAQTLTGAILTGRYTVDGAKTDAAPKEDRYTITRATKMRGGDLWLLATRIQFGGKDVTVPLVVPIKWAGDTPVISVTDLTVPGVGTYTARVVMYRDHYAGTWSGKDHGGAMWGTVGRAATTERAHD